MSNLVETSVIISTNIYRCNGGAVSVTMTYILSKGIELESDYGKYLNKRENCKSPTGKFKPPNFCYALDSGNEEMLFNVINKYEAAVAVAMHVQNSFVSYSKGIYDDTTCPSKLADATHSVVGELNQC